MSFPCLVWSLYCYHIPKCLIRRHPDKGGGKGLGFPLSIIGSRATYFTTLPSVKLSTPETTPYNIILIVSQNLQLSGNVDINLYKFAVCCLLIVKNAQLLQVLSCGYADLSPYPISKYRYCISVIICHEFIWILMMLELFIHFKRVSC